MYLFNMIVKDIVTASKDSNSDAKQHKSLSKSQVKPSTLKLEDTDYTYHEHRESIPQDMMEYYIRNRYRIMLLVIPFVVLSSIIIPPNDSLTFKDEVETLEGKQRASIGDKSTNVSSTLSKSLNSPVKNASSKYSNDISPDVNEFIKHTGKKSSIEEILRTDKINKSKSEEIRFGESSSSTSDTVDKQPEFKAILKTLHSFYYAKLSS